MPYGSLSVGCEEHLDPAGTGSFYNEGEADIIVQHVFSLLYAGMYPYNYTKALLIISYVGDDSLDFESICHYLSTR